MYRGGDGALDSGRIRRLNYPKRRRRFALPAHSKWARFQRTGVLLVSYEFPEFNINLGNFSY